MPAYEISERSYWAKDIVLVFADGLHGMSAWLQAYHGHWNKGWTGDRLRFHAGSIQAALVLDFGQSADYNYLGALLGTFYTSHSIYLTLPPAIEGTDGQMPNLDLLNVIVEIARYEGVPVQLHSTYFNSKPIQQNNQPYLLEWMNAMRNVLTMMLNQASGVPSGLHGLFLRYRIDALTLCGVQGPLSVRLGVWQTAMVVESTFRSLNNLLERFHQSFFYYLLAQPYRYISIAMYYPPLGLIVAGMLLVALGIWFETSQYFDPSPLESSSSPPTDKGFRRSLPAYNTRPRNLLPPLLVLLSCFSLSVVVYASPFVLTAAMRREPWLQSMAGKLGGLGAVVVIFNVLFTGISVWLIRRKYVGAIDNNSSSKNFIAVDDNRLLKFLLLLIALIALAGISVINFPHALALAALISPVLTFIGPRYPLRRPKAIGDVADIDVEDSNDNEGCCDEGKTAAAGRHLQQRESVVGKLGRRASRVLKRTVHVIGQTGRQLFETALVMACSPLGASVMIYLTFIRAERSLDSAMMELYDLIFRWLPTTLAAVNLADTATWEWFLNETVRLRSSLDYSAFFFPLLGGYSEWIMHLLNQWDLVGSACWQWISMVWTPLCMAACVLVQS